MTKKGNYKWYVASCIFSIKWLPLTVIFCVLDKMNAASWRGRWLIIKWSVLPQAVGDGGAWSLEKSLPGQDSMREKDTIPIFATRNFRKALCLLKTIRRAVYLTDLLWKVCLVYLLLSAVWLACVNAGHTAEVLLVQRHLVIIPEKVNAFLYIPTL